MKKKLFGCILMVVLVVSFCVSVSNVLKTRHDTAKNTIAVRHDTAKNSISNIR